MASWEIFISFSGQIFLSVPSGSFDIVSDVIMFFPIMRSHGIDMMLVFSVFDVFSKC